MSRIDSSGHLSRGLSNRHIQLIALGGAIGTGLFLGSSKAISIAGPAILLGYAIGGFVAFMIMRQLAEMTVEEPVAGSFSHFAYRYWSPFAGFASGWNYWLLYVLVSMSELTAAAQYIHYWLPQVPTWISVLSCFVLINAINLMAVKIYGEVEFWFAIIKVIAVIAMIVFGGYLLFSGNAGPEASVTNLWAHQGFMPNGIKGLIIALAIIMFSFGGLELIGITAAEAEQPEKTIPKATNQVIYRILIFYIGALTVLLCLHPWNQINPNESAFVTVFHDLDQSIVSHVLNFVVLTAALSVYNSGLYCNSRMLYGLAEQGNAPKQLMYTNRRGTPIFAVILSGLATLTAVILNYYVPKEAFSILLALVVSALVINWAMISFTHIMFRRHKNKQGVVPKFKALFYPVGNIICLIFLTGMLVILAMDEGMRLSVELIPVWIVILAVGYGIKLYLKGKKN
ncbi:amino acid permease [Entomomonas asaccharolytica]|uniref:Amino acid permease n=1 Tax=Entomomonas asaccharolytica TaxID=2785331 RepID=A0A974NFV1_9GAMM|nr:amino acid permease [Entomomonas asaccharolytica]QQP85814.1 amino acid permease [Entomomonas asaccharolytica]